MSKALRIGITIGDFNGIGPELILKTLLQEQLYNYCTPVIYADPAILRHYSELYNMDKLEFELAKNPDQMVDGRANFRFPTFSDFSIEPGTASVEAGKYALASLNLAIEDVKEGHIQNILTAPINKHTTKEAGLAFNGHTQFFAQAFESESLMILMDEELKVAMVTGHRALNEVSSGISEDQILNSLDKLSDSLLFDFNIESPRIAVLGLNPHLGDKGEMGDEDQTIIAPAIERAKNELNLNVLGPFPPDGFFGAGNESKFDAVLGMYHDQVLIPFKQKSFDEGVNFTAGLPIVRTSPDHGTAYDIAGKNIASLSSFVNALYLINRIHRNRLENYGKKKPFLGFRDHRREKFSIGVPDLK